MKKTKKRSEKKRAKIRKKVSVKKISKTKEKRKAKTKTKKETVSKRIPTAIKIDIKKEEKEITGEETMEERKENLKRFLLRLREDILKEAKTEVAKYIKGETKQIVETALDDGDWSVVDLAEDISLKQLSTHRENLVKIDEALRKVDENTYGICEECGEEIPEERLKIMPFAIYCLDCQERKEMLEKLEKELE